MATKKPRAAKPADPKQALQAKIAGAKTVRAKQKDKAKNDPKRRLAVKKLKRAQRHLGKLKAMEKKAAEAAKKPAAEA